MKIRSGFVSNSSSSSFICKCTSDAELVSKDINLIQSELLRDDLSDFSAWNLSNYILRNCTVYSAYDPSVEYSYEIMGILGNLDDSELLELYRSDMSIKEFLTSRQKFKNAIVFEYSSDGDNSEYPFEYCPKEYLKCDFEKISHH